MKNITLIIIALLTFVGNALADNISVQDVSVKKGESATIAVALNNTATDYSGLQFDLTLPAGFSLKTDANQYINITASSRLTNSQSVAGRKRSNGTYRFTLLAIDGSAIGGTSGSLFTVTVTNNSAAEGSKNKATISGIILGTTSSKRVTFDDASFTLSVPTTSPVSSSDKLSVADVSLSANKSTAASFALQNSRSDYAGFQFDVTLPEGIAFDTDVNGNISTTKGRIQSNQLLSAAKLSNGAYRFVFLSPDASTLSGTSGELFSANLKNVSAAVGSYKGKISNAIFTGRDLTTYNLPDAEFAIAVKSSIPTADNNYLYSQDLSADGGTIVTLPISLKNESPVEGFQFDLVLPEGASVIQNGNDLAASLTERGSKLQLSSLAKENNTYRFIVSSGTASIASGDGVVLNIKIKTPANIGSYPVKVDGITLKTNDSKGFAGTDFSMNLNITSNGSASTISGDVNNDGIVNVVDVVLLKKYLVNDIDDDFNKSVADINGDGVINVFDITSLINLALNAGKK